MLLIFKIFACFAVIRWKLILSVSKSPKNSSKGGNLHRPGRKLFLRRQVIPDRFHDQLVVVL